MLPAEILAVVFQQLSRRDLRNVHMVCWYFHDIANPLLYSQMGITWDDVEILMTSDDDPRREWVRHLAVIEASSWGEWKQSPKLGRLAGQLQSLFVACDSQSSGWLKYVTPPLEALTRLELRAGMARHRSFFDFDHIINSLPHLTSLELHEFHLEHGEPHPELKRLVLVDCSWEYPARIANFSQVLDTLEICLWENWPFALSERFKLEASDPPEGLRSLVLRVSVPVAWTPLRHGSKSLQHVSLHGFATCRDHLADLPCLRSLNENGALLIVNTAPGVD